MKQLPEMRYFGPRKFMFRQ